jgi:hypothetical protein
LATYSVPHQNSKICKILCHCYVSSRILKSASSTTRIPTLADLAKYPYLVKECAQAQVAVQINHRHKKNSPKKDLRNGNISWSLLPYLRWLQISPNIKFQLPRRRPNQGLGGLSHTKKSTSLLNSAKQQREQGKYKGRFLSS